MAGKYPWCHQQTEAKPFDHSSPTPEEGDTAPSEFNLIVHYFAECLLLASRLILPWSMCGRGDWGLTNKVDHKNCLGTSLNSPRPRQAAYLNCVFFVEGAVGMGSGSIVIEAVQAIQAVCNLTQVENAFHASATHT